MEIKKILFPTDFSEAANKAFEYAVFLASSHHSELVLLHVVDDLHGFENYEILTYTPQEISEQMEKSAYEKMGRLAGRIKAPSEVRKEVRHGKSSSLIIETAGDEKADIIVMGSHGRSGFSHMFIGSVAEKVVRHAPCPVLVVRDRG